MSKVPKLSKKAADDVIAQALSILTGRLERSPDVMGDAATVMDYLRVKLGALEHEVVGVMFLDVRFRLIKDQVMFRGTVNHSYMYAREIVKEALKHNAAAIIVYHNHPSGDVKPSPGDIFATKQLKTACEAMNINLNDHIIVAGTKTFSFGLGGLL